MSRQTITSRSAPIVWSTVDEAFEKINANFAELYASIGETGSIGFDALATNLIPSQNATYSLGTATTRWSNLYLSGVLSIGGAAITNEGLTIDLPSGTTVAGQLIIDPEKPFFKEVSVNGNTSVVADQFNDTINLEEGTGVSLNVNSSSDTIIITNSGVTSVLGSAGITVSSATGTVTISNTGVRTLTTSNGLSTNTSATGDVSVTNTGVLRLEAGPSITISNGGLPDVDGKIIITNSAPAGNAYRIIAVAGEATLTAPSLAATLTLIEGSGINITTALASGALTNRVTFENTGVLSLTAGAGITLSGSTGAVTVGFNNAIDIVGSVFADNSTMLVDGTNGRIVGPVFANVTGDVTGNTTGYHTGDVKGSVFGDDSGLIVDGLSGRLYGALTGDVTGNVTGFLTGDVKGSVFGDDSTVLVNSTDSKIVGPVESATVKASTYIQTAVYADATAITAGIPTAVKGMIVYDNALSQFKGFNGSIWVALN
jgi:hypothetical protein